MCRERNRRVPAQFGHCLETADGVLNVRDAKPFHLSYGFAGSWELPSDVCVEPERSVRPDRFPHFACDVDICLQIAVPDLPLEVWRAMIFDHLRAVGGDFRWAFLSSVDAC